MRRIALALFLTIAPLPAHAAPSPFDLFKAVCIDSGTTLAGVDKAALAAGGFPRPPGHVDDQHTKSVIQFWDFGPKMRINLNVSRTSPQADYPATNMANCTLDADFRDNGSTERFRTWIGVPTDSPKNYVELYEFLDENGKHLPVPKDKAGHEKALRAGHLWMAHIVVGDKNSTSLGLTYAVRGP